ALDEVEAAHRRLRDAAAKATEDREAACETRDAASADLATGGEAWRSAVALLGLAGTTTPEEAEAALQDWAGIAEATSAWQAAEIRIGQMEAAIAALAGMTSALAEPLGEARREEPPGATAARLARRLEEARRIEIKAQELARQAEGRRAAAAVARAALEEAEAELARLHGAAGTADLAALREAV
ncbi:hypothetical protein, partial [Falsiroseomonas oryziterrae]|uniref:hypothetical protein n=1 Tax=Falsiroseomonas oryziterrae TaxID=2911368 RepID=UPI001F472479